MRNIHHHVHQPVVLGGVYILPSFEFKINKTPVIFRIIDNIFSQEDVQKLHDVVKKGMDQRKSLGGPTILDINTGYIRDSAGLDNLFVKKDEIYTSDDFATYGRVISRLKSLVAETFGLTELYFTAPTFITRLDGRSSWEPEGLNRKNIQHPQIAI